ncbi:InlB B-repeat-containing protein [Treponema denticola]|uniref:InlB B-repeat-containing protein n=1 Tax=Treponema denticola TaxID=158 RepID=UPI0020A5F928|nr:InlB B-repeat-containing protein [Treponema denticola]UTC92375.1 InlB B-repeat-containing protein [Treponema denticola]
MKRLLKILTAAVAVILLFTACQQFLEDPEDFLSYWASEVFVKDHSIDSAHRPDKAGVPCVGSSAPVNITLSVHNPKGFSFVMPTSLEPAGIVEFKELSEPPAAGTHYELERIGSGTLKLTYKTSLLQKYEQGLGSLNPTITLKAKDGRVFKKTYTFGIKSNTPPPKPEEIVIAKTTGTDPHYVLCLKFKLNEMTKTVPIGSPSVPVHKDIRSITINNSSYSLLYEGNNLDFKKPASDLFIEFGEVEKLDTSSPDVPQGKWVLYFNTGVKVESYIPQTSYIITLSDEGGVVSDSVTAELRKRFKVTFDSQGGSIVPDQYIEKDGKVTKPTNPTKAGFDFGGWYTNTSYSTQWNFDTNTVTGNMTLYAKWTEKNYTVTFSVAGGQGELKGTCNGQSQIVQNGSGEVSLTNVPHGAQVTFTAKPTDPSQYKVGNWTCTPSTDFTGTSGSQTATLTVKADTTVTVQFVQLNALTLRELKIHGKDAKSGSVTLPYTVTQVTQSDITLEFSGHSGIPFTVTPTLPLNLIPGYTESITINVAASPGNYLAWSKTVSITRSKNNVASLKSFKLNGETKNAPFDSEYTVASNTAEVKDFTFDTASTGATASVSPQGSVSIPVGTGRSFTITVKAQDGTQNTVTFTVKRQKYNISYSVAGGHGKIKADSGSEVVNGSKQVEYGENISFTATPDNGWEVDSWKVDGSTVFGQTGTTYHLSNVTGDKTVTVKFKPGTFNLTGGGPDAWKKLKEEAAKTEGSHTIVINGEITATTDQDNNGKISIRRELIIKSSGSSASLNANNLSGIFNVDKKLTLENITLKNGKEPGDRTGAGAYVNNSTLIMKGSSTITNCSAHKGGGVYVNNGTLIMQDSSAISSCTAVDKGSGVYVSGTFKMSGSAKVDTNSDVYLAFGKSIDVTGTLTNTPAARITPDSYTDGRVLATGAAEKANFTVTPKNGNEHWRYKKKDGVIKFVPATLTVTFVKLKCVKEKDYGDTAEYYWTMKVNGVMVDDQFNENSTCELATGQIHTINKSFTESFSYFPADKKIPVDIEIYEEDNGSDNHIGTTKASLWYHYNADAWQWGYRGSGHENGNQGVNTYKQINEGSAYEVEFTEQYRHSEGDTDVTIKISWKE